MKKLTLLSTLIFAVITITAQIIHIPADQPTIQEGINAASDGDTVLVAEGTYLENINFSGKAITVASNFIMDDDTSHISNTIIDGSQPENPDIGSVVTFESGEDTTSILCGFTITGGSGTSILEGPTDARAGGGINFNRSGGKLLYNYIESNQVLYDKLTMGGGLTAGGPITPLPWLVMVGNKIRNNKSVSTALQANGGGLEIYYNVIMMDNEISNNEARAYSGISLGGGVSLYGAFGHLEVIARNNKIKQNKAVSFGVLGGYSEGGGLSVTQDVSGIIEHNEISFNSVEMVTDQNGYGAGVVTIYPSPDLVFANNIVTNNTYSGGSCYGGGLAIWHGGGNYHNNVIQNNAATYGGGICLGHESDSLPILFNNTITGNEGVYGGGLYKLQLEAVVINSILWDNVATEGPGIYEVESNLEVHYSNVQGEEEWPGIGNINIDPGFKNDGYHLDWESELVNQGISAIQIGNDWYDAPEYDIDGNDRPFDGTDPDIGADEALWYYVQLPESASNETSSLNVFPNPVSSSFSTIEYKLDRASVVQVSLFNQFGELVEVLVDDHQSKGNYQIVWNFESLPAGIYFCYLKTVIGTQTTKIIKLK